MMHSHIHEVTHANQTVTPGREHPLTLRAPPNSRHAIAFLMSSCPKMEGAMWLQMRPYTSGWRANSRNSASCGTRGGGAKRYRSS